MKKGVIIFIIVFILAVVAGVLIYINFSSQTPEECMSKCIQEGKQPEDCINQCRLPKNLPGDNFSKGKCGDGTCDQLETERGICPEDCEEKPTAKKTGDFEDSPFGFLTVPPQNFVDDYNDLGTHWLRGPERVSSWEQIESIKGKYDFSEKDSEICDLYQNRQNLIVAIRSVNKLYGTTWVEGVLKASDEYPDGYLDEWRDFIKAYIERYDGDGIDDVNCQTKVNIKNYQFVHELGPTEMDYWQSHRDQYAEVFEITYKAMKEACSDCTLYMPVPFISDLMNESNFLSEVLGYLKGKDLPDIGFDYHYWSTDLSKPRSENWKTQGEDYMKYVEHIKKIKEIASKYGFSASNIISAESGMGATAEMEKDQAGYVIRSYVSSLANGQKKMLWTTTLEYSHYPEENIFANTGLINNPQNSDGLSHKKLAYYTYKLMVEKLEGSDWNNIEAIIDGVDNVYAYKFIKKDTGKIIYVVWWDYFNDSENNKTISLNVDFTDSVLITEAVPNADSGSEINEKDYPDFFNTETKTVQNGKITITLDESPVFVEGN